MSENLIPEAGMGKSGVRVLKILDLAITQVPDEPASEICLDLIMAAALLMLAVSTGTKGHTSMCPPMSGRPHQDRAMQAVSELAESMLGRLPEEVS